MNLVTLRYNLVNTGILSNRQALWLVALGPVGVSGLTVYCGDFGDALDTLCSLAIGYWVPLWLYVKAMRQSPLALRDDVRKDLLRMSISGFRPVNGNSIGNVQVALRKWAKYAGRKDAQLRILLKLDEPEERRQFLRRQSSFVGAGQSNPSSPSSLLSPRRHSLGSHPSIASGDAHLAPESSDDARQDELWSVVPSEAARRLTSLHSLESMVPSELKRPPARSTGARASAKEGGPRLHEDVAYMSLRWQRVWEAQRSRSSSESDNEDDDIFREESIIEAQREPPCGDTQTPMVDDFEIWQLMYPIEDIVTSHRNHRAAEYARSAMTPQESRSPGNRGKSLRFAPRLVTNASSVVSLSLSSHARLDELRQASIARFNERVHDDIQNVLEDLPVRERVRFEAIETDGKRTTKKDDASLTKTVARFGNATSIAPTAGPTSSYQDEADTAPTVLCSPHDTGDEMDCSSNSGSVPPFERRRGRLATDWRPALLSASDQMTSSASDEDGSDEHPFGVFDKRNSAADLAATDGLVRAPVTVLQLTKANLAKLNMQSESSPKAVVTRAYLSEVHRDARKLGGSDWLKIAAETPQRVDRRITMATGAETPSPKRDESMSPQGPLTLVLERDTAPAFYELLTPEAMSSRNSPLAHRMSLMSSVSTRVPDDQAAEMGSVARMLKSIASHYHVLKCFYAAPGPLLRGCSLHLDEDAEVTKIIKRCLSNQKSALQRSPFTLSPASRSVGWSPSSFRREKVVLPVRPELAYLIKVSRVEQQSALNLSPRIGSSAPVPSSKGGFATGAFLSIKNNGEEKVYYILYPRVWLFRVVIVIMRIYKQMTSQIYGGACAFARRLEVAYSRFICLIQIIPANKKCRTNACTYNPGQRRCILDQCSASSIATDAEDSLIILPSSNSSSDSRVPGSEAATSSSRKSDISKDGRRLHQLLKFRRSGRKREVENRPRHMNRMELTPVMGADQQFTMTLFAILVILILPSAIMIDWISGNGLDWGSPSIEWLVNAIEFRNFVGLSDIHLNLSTSTWQFFAGRDAEWPAATMLALFL